MKALRPLSDEEAFHFYVALSQPTGDSAVSLIDFLEKIRSVKLESLAFHIQRKDFMNWARTTLGDSKLARVMGRMRSVQGDCLREKMHAAVEKRIKELTETPWTIIVGDDVISALPENSQYGKAE